MLLTSKALGRWHEARTFGKLLDYKSVLMQIPSQQLCLKTCLRKQKSPVIKNSGIKIIPATSAIPSVEPPAYDYSDSFGTLNHKSETQIDLDDNDGESEYLAKIADTERPKPFDYLNQIEMLLKPPNVDLQQALEVFEVDMKREYVKPIPEIYRVLIHACGNKGYCDKAFELYRQYTSRRFPANHGIFSDLFNSCANCPKDKEIMKNRALQHAKKLYLKINASYTGHLHPVLYHNMIKAFGRCGEIEYAFDLLDKMGEKRVRVNASTICHLLHGCINDKESGLRHALILWRKMRRFRIQPNVQSYNLMLRAVKECGVGDPQFLQDILIESMSSKDVRKLKRKSNDNLIADHQNSSNIPLLTETAPTSTFREQVDNSYVVCADRPGAKDSTVSKIVNNDDKTSTLIKTTEVLPNFLSPTPNFDCDHGIVGLSENALRSSQEKFSLFGNASEFLELMINIDHVEPDIKTISQLLHCIEPQDEYLLLKYIKQYKITTDIDFFNQLMRKRVTRYDYHSARKTLEDISEFDLAPDIATFGCLAMTCSNDKLMFNLLKDMNISGIKPNVQIITALLKSACYRCSFKGVEVMLDIMTKRNIKPTIQTITTLEHFYQTCRKIIISLDRGDINEKLNHSTMIVKVLKDDLSKGSSLWSRHLTMYTSWLEKTEIDYPSHPWKQFLTSKDIEKSKIGPETKRIYLNQIINDT